MGETAANQNESSETKFIVQSMDNSCKKSSREVALTFMTALLTMLVLFAGPFLLICMVPLHPPIHSNGGCSQVLGSDGAWGESTGGARVEP